MAESGLVFQDINKLDEVSKASDSDVLVLTDKQSNNATIIAYINFVSTLLDELDSKSYTLDTGKQTLINAINSLNTRINNITASAEADSVSQAEIVDARIAEPTLVADRLVEASYSILGEAIRAQINALYNEIKNIVTEYIEDGAVTTAKIAPRAVTGALLALSSVAFEHLNSTLQNRITTIESKATASEAKNAEQDTQIGELESNLQEEVGAINETLALKADQDGDYDDLTAGGARQLLSTVYVDDSKPYNFRTAGGSADIGDRVTEEVVGGSIVWNQLRQNGNFANGTTGFGAYSGSSASVADNVCTITVDATPVREYSVALRETSNRSYTAGHKFFITYTVKVPKSGEFSFDNNRLFVGSHIKTATTANVWQTKQHIMEATGEAQTCYFFPQGVTDGYAIGDTWQIKNIMFIDLTQMFGSTIADYIYSLEQGTAGAGVAWFRKLFPKPYYAYNAGELMSVKAGAHNTVGFNAWDEEWEVGAYSSADGQKITSVNDRIRSKNFIPVIPSATYYVNKGLQIYFYDKDKKFIDWQGSGNSWTLTMKKGERDVYYVTFNGLVNSGTTYKNDICINLSWDGERDGEYEPYEKHSYPLDELELRGIPKLDANNQLYYDGDTYASDGTVTRRYGIVDLGTLNWSIDVQSSYTRFLASLAPVTGMPVRAVNTVCSKYISLCNNETFDTTWDKVLYAGGGLVMVHDSAYSDVATFKTAMSGVYLVYELAEPTTETADSFVSPQVVNDFGTEEYTDFAVEAGDRDVAIPVGHNSQYMNNLRAKLEMAPDSPDGDGDYIVRQSNGENSYVPYTADGRLDAVEETLDLKADANGDYDDLTAGGAKQLLSTVYVDDNEPYNFRTAGGSADIGDRMYEEVVGGSIVWNQWAATVNGYNWGARGAEVTFSDGIATVTPRTDGTQKGLISANPIWTDSDMPVNHILYIAVDVKAPITGAIRLTLSGVQGAGTNRNAFNITADTWTRAGVMYKPIAQGPSKLYYLVEQSLTTEQTIQYKNPLCIDLTQMFGSTIADYIYSLEQGTAGAGVAWFRNLFPKPYYEYNAGELMSVKAGSHDTVGFNSWDEETELGKLSPASGAAISGNSNLRAKNYIPIVGGQTYHMKTDSAIRTSDMVFCWYDADKNYISYVYSGGGVNITAPANAKYGRFYWGAGYGTTYKNDTCFHLAWDGERNGEYEPYEKHEYPLAELELRGIPKLDANNQLYYDGDTYASDGTVTRKYGNFTPNSTQDWAPNVTVSTETKYEVYRPITGAKTFANVISDKFTPVRSFDDNPTFTVRFGASNNNLIIGFPTSVVSTAAQAKAWFDANPTQIVYELAEPTTETADTFVNPQVVDDFGTEEYVDYAEQAGDRDVAIPVGHNSQYMNNLRAKLEMAPDSPSGDGKYIVQQSNGENAYIPYTADGRLDAIEAKLPAPPSTNGTYKLTATVTDGGVTYAWVAG